MPHHRPFLILAGVFLIAAALTLSSSGIEFVLTGSRSGSLSWGPHLFRALLALHGALLATIGLMRTAGVSAPSRNAHPPKPQTLLILSLLSFVALGLRLWQLDSCLWLDEVLTLTDFARPPLGRIVSAFPNQNQHMLYSILSHSSLQLFGEHAWTLRLPSVLFGVGCLWALFGLARRFVDDNEALLTCALMTVSYHHIWFSQNARGYMGLLFFAILATWLWLKALDQGTWRFWIWYGVACFLGIWMHMTMVFVPASHALIHILFRGRPGSRVPLGWKPVAAWLLSGTLALQVHAIALPEFLRTAVHESSRQSDWTSPLWVLTESLRSLRIGFSGIIVLTFVLLMISAGWAGIFRRHAPAALAMVLPGLLGGVSMLALSHNLWPRFFFFCMGFTLIIAVHGAVWLGAAIARPLEALTPGHKLQRVFGFLFVSVIIAASAATVPRCYALPKQDFTGARDFVEAGRTAGSGVVAVGTAAYVYKRYYAPEWYVAETALDLDALRRKHSNLALVYSLGIELKTFHPDIWAMVQQDFEVVRTFPGTLGGGEVYVCMQRLKR